MGKSDLRKMMLKYMRYLTELKEIKVFTLQEKKRQERDIKIIKNKIKVIRRSLEK